MISYQRSTGNWLAPIAPELQCHEREQHALAGAGRADHKGVADVTDVKRQEWSSSFGLGEEKGRVAEMVVALGSRPHR
jgi:hypothetical protein